MKIYGASYILNGKIADTERLSAAGYSQKDLDEAYQGTIAYSILNAHSVKGAEKDKQIAVKFDALASHDITYVGIIQTAKASGLQKFPLPYVLTNCHNSLCAVGGTINEDDHLFGLSAAKKYGGIFVPAHQAVIHTYMRECFAKCGAMILGSDSHTRYGALGTMAMGEGGPELVKQLLGMTYDVKYPQVVAIVLKGAPRRGVGPHDVAIALIGEVFKKGIVKNKVLEFIGEGVTNLPVEYRNGIDVTTTETACLSSIWQTDYKVKEYLAVRGRAADYKKLEPKALAYYDEVIEIDLSEIEPMIALPFHPSNAYKLSDLIQNPGDILSEASKNINELLGGKVSIDLTKKIKNGGVYVEQAVIAGCAGGTFDNICESASILKGKRTGNGEFQMSVYPGSQPVFTELVKNGSIATLMQAGVSVRSCFCGPCFGAGDVPANDCLSIRHTTRNFESREGSKPLEGQISAVALMDARSISATAANGGRLTSALDVDYDASIPPYTHDDSSYKSRVYNGYGKADPSVPLRYGPNIADWPKIPSLRDNAVYRITAVIHDPVTTTDELIPSGETSSYRSNPLRLAEFALSRKVPEYVGRCKVVKKEADEYMASGVFSEEIAEAVKASGLTLKGDTLITSAIYAVKPGDGSAREQAASCQRVLGAGANFAVEYATKRYRSNLINWGMVPYLTQANFEVGDIVIVPDVKERLLGDKSFDLYIVRAGKVIKETAYVDKLTDDEKTIIKDGCLINYYANKK